VPKAHPQTTIPLDIPNPFLQDRVDSPWQECFQDVPEINRTAFQSIQNSIAAVCQTNQSRGLILHGEPGSGKTHLLQRLRFFTQREPRTWFIYIPPFPGPNRFWRHLLECFFYDVCQRSKQANGPARPTPDKPSAVEGPGQGPLTQIEEALTRHLVERPLETTQNLAGWWAEICRKDLPGEPLFRRLKPTFDQLTVRFRLDPDVMKVLRHYLSWNHRASAYADLLGRDLPEEDLQLLGVKQSLDDEERARQAVLTFCRVAGTAFTIILAFDQIEGLQLDPHDFDGLRAFAKNAVDLMSQCGNLLILSAVQTYFLSALGNAMHASYYQRIAQDESVLEILSKESAKKLIAYRLDTQKEFAGLRNADARRGPLWPFNVEEIEKLIPVGGLPARELIRRVRHLFDEKKSAPLPPIKSLAERWKEDFERELNRPLTRLDEGVYEDGLLKLLQIKPLRGWRARRGKEKDLHVILERDAEKIGISVSHSENMTSLASQLKRLLDLIERKSVGKLIFLRDARLPISAKAKATQERLQEIVKKGSRVIRPPAEAYAALNVLRELWNKAAENDLTVGDSTISMGELKKWLAENTPRPLEDLIEDACKGIEEPPPVDTGERLLEILRGRWIMPLSQAAQQLAMPEAFLSSFTNGAQEVAGVLDGPPPVLFLLPEALSRS